jgi:hypothetical protein
MSLSLSGSVVGRRGNAIIMALGLVSIAAAMIVVSATGSVSSYQQTAHRNHQIRAMAAVEAVLQRAESRVAVMAENGRLATWTGRDGEEPNFGVEYFGGCEVKWRIEPARTPQVTETVNPTGDTVEYLTNPSPNTFYTPTAPGEVINESVYLFRVAAQATLVGSGGQDTSVAQGMRYVSVNEEPLFRYVIFYAKEGPKGDLELSHGPGVEIKGGIYSNGAIYFGAGTEVNKWDALDAPVTEPTVIGPDANNDQVSVVGVDGLFRLSKPILYGHFNSFPFDTSTSNPGMQSTDYELGNGSYPNDIPGGDDASFTTATLDGTRLNPYRIKGKAANTNSRIVTINNVPLVGPSGSSSDPYPAGNDSRDHQRDADHKWDPASLQSAASGGFSGLARSEVTHARVKRLPDMLKNRPFEAQRLSYDENGPTDDPLDDFDEHDEALPLFVDATGSETISLGSAFAPGSSGPFESSGQYVRYALGGDGVYFARRIPFTGWDIRDLSGSTSTALIGTSGLIIRERPLPDLSYFNGAEVQPADISNRNYLPFAYGKHRTPSVWPFTEMWISDGATVISATANNSKIDNGYVKINSGGTTTISTSATNTLQFYNFGGLTTMISASTAGCTSAASDAPADPNGYWRGNWRFLHLNNATVTRAGTVAKADTRTGSAFYFTTATFGSLQAQLSSFTGGNAIPGAQGRKAGLMLRAVNTATPNNNGIASNTDLSSWTLNGRQPYAAILYAPERGFFSQYRQATSSPAPVDAFFNATDASQLGMAAVGTKKVKEYSNTIATTTNGTTSANTTLTNFGQVTLSNAEGSWNFAIGPYIVKNTKTPYAQSTRTLVLTLDTGFDWGFSTSDAGKNFKGFASPYNDTTIILDASIGGVDTTSGSLITGTSPAQYRRISFSIPGTKVSANALATTATTTTANQGTSTTIFKGQKDYDTAKNVYLAKGKTEADLIAFLNSKGYAVATVPSNPSAATPAQPAASTATAPTNYDFVTPRLFKVTRSTKVETNSYISRRGKWFTPAVPQWLSSPAIPVGVTPPPTSSFAPDMWTGLTAPTNTSAVTNTDGSIVSGTTGGPGAAVAWEDCLPASWSSAMANNTNQWLRLERVTATNRVRFKYYLGNLVPPADDAVSRTWPNWVTLTNPANGSAVECDMTSWPAEMVAGLCESSGSTSNPATARFNNITYTKTTNVVTGLKSDGSYTWEATGTPNPMTLYLCSQYQVFFGTQEITEDFFLFGESSPSTRLANENWFYDPRIFWSQSRWFNQNEANRSAWIEKETGSTAANPNNYTNTTWRQLWARTTVLDINMRNVQDYLKNRSIKDATSDAIAVGSTLVPINDSSSLASRFSGLFYAARTNRYPTNPNLGSVNPFNVGLPNSNNNLLNLTDSSLTWNNAADRPPLSPPMRPSEFHHGVMISNAASIDWDINASGTQPFGTSKTSFTTPNRLYIRGDLNTTDQSVNYKGTDNTAAIVPLAIMGDQITFLSNNWDPLLYQNDGLTTNAAGTPTGGILATASGTTASTTTYRTCIVTNNQPTTKSRVFEGQCAPFVDTMLFMENWSTSTMNYLGSLVVLDASRYANNFLLPEKKTYGTTPFGIIGWHSLASWGGTSIPDWCVPPAGTGNGTPNVYLPPIRKMTFNLDLLTEEGTPPKTPFGLTSTGVGGWARILR